MSNFDDKLDEILETHAESWIDIHQARKLGDYDSNQAIEQFEASSHDAKQAILELIEDLIDKTGKDIEKVSSAHELYSGSIDAHSFRAGWGMGLANLNAELRERLGIE